MKGLLRLDKMAASALTTRVNFCNMGSSNWVVIQRLVVGVRGYERYGGVAEGMRGSGIFA